MRKLRIWLARAGSLRGLARYPVYLERWEAAARSVEAAPPGEPAETEPTRG